MRRIQEKVKDLVEVRSYPTLKDFLSDPAQTLAAYYFTDQTADMMSKWLDAVAGVQIQNGAAKALAGYRGVGKSHFLATLGAIVSHPELRSRVTDPVVAASAQRLKRRRHPVAYVRRGTKASLLEEIKDALAITLETDAASLSDSLEEMLGMCAEKAGDLPFVIIIDTAFDRATRVSRDDGVLLGKVAEIAKNLNVFVAVALDDDISGADGVNAAIARIFTINYLDQEHLYRVVDLHVFPKFRHSAPVLHEVYEYFRELLPGFRWSEQRFTSLYPLHPLILEIAPFVRLYATEFALLGFASEAGAKVLGRPANSLVGLDEVFDRTEPVLRKSEDLREAFQTFDKINSEVISQIPVMQRLQAKLVLKALMLLSLDGDGTTPSEISAAMLIYDENNPQNSIRSVEELLEKFVDLLPDAVNRIAVPDREVRYSLKVAGKDNLNQALRDAAQSVSPDVIPRIMRRFASERFSDWILLSENEAVDSTDCQIIWRGGFRRGRVFWNWLGGGTQNVLRTNSEIYDWEIFVNPPQGDSAWANLSNVPVIAWQPALLQRDEVETIKRYYVLITDSGLQEQYGEQVRAAGHALTETVAKIWNRIFLEQGKILINGREFEFSERAKQAHTLSEVFSDMLSPLFDARYPEHPIFADVLGINEVSALVGDLFGGARQNSPETQHLAANFAAPLGLVALRGDQFVLETDENLLRLPLVKEILAKVNESGNETVLLRDIYRQLKREPNGLVREAVQLLLAALVARRRIEFVTSKNDRISRRSLDLKIIWDDIIGIARPATVLHSSEVLTNWARTLTAVDTFRSIDEPADRERIRAALANWLNEWLAADVLARFEKLPEDILNTKIWRLAANAGKTFGAVAAAVEEVLNDGITLEECLQRVADAFSNSEKEFLERTKDLVRLEDFINGAALRETVWEYLAICEITEDEALEQLREKLLESIDEMSFAPSEVLNREIERLWEAFLEKYTEHYAVKHDTVMRAHHLQEKFDEMMRSDEWWEFENLSALPIFQKTHWQQAEKICRRFKHLDCRIAVREMLKKQPFCACSFRLSQMKEWEQMPRQLADIIYRGRQSYRKTLMILRETLIPLLKYLAEHTKEEEYAAAAKLLQIFQSGAQIPLLSNAELIILEKAVKAMPASPMLSVGLPEETGYLSRTELREIFSEWLDELPSEPVLVKI